MGEGGTEEAVTECSDEGELGGETILLEAGVAGDLDGVEEGVVGLASGVPAASVESRPICDNRLAKQMNVPVLPTPALQWTRIGGSVAPALSCRDMVRVCSRRESS